jgi:hypothetical protein
MSRAETAVEGELRALGVEITSRKLHVLSSNLENDEHIIEAFNGSGHQAWASTAVVLTKTRALVLNEDQRDLGNLFWLVPPYAHLDDQVYWEDVERVDTTLGGFLEVKFCWGRGENTPNGPLVRRKTEPAAV